MQMRQCFATDGQTERILQMHSESFLRRTGAMAVQGFAAILSLRSARKIQRIRSHAGPELATRENENNFYELA